MTDEDLMNALEEMDGSVSSAIENFTEGKMDNLMGDLVDIEVILRKVAAEVGHRGDIASIASAWEDEV